ncbi:MAG: hypothetical protein Ta2D_13310 [Rickettsiales bacterium]|nr:MAG: hypothetical protein Ta2D_13310 [Rickettsiales bacterium]
MKRKSIVLSLVLSVLVLNLAGCGGSSSGGGGGGGGPVVVNPTVPDLSDASPAEIAGALADSLNDAQIQALITALQNAVRNNDTSAIANKTAELEDALKNDFAGEQITAIVDTIKENPDLDITNPDNLQELVSDATQAIDNKNHGVEFLDKDVVKTALLKGMSNTSALNTALSDSKVMKADDRYFNNYNNNDHGKYYHFTATEDSNGLITFNFANTYKNYNQSFKSNSFVEADDILTAKKIGELENMNVYCVIDDCYAANNETEIREKLGREFNNNQTQINNWLSNATQETLKVTNAYSLKLFGKTSNLSYSNFGVLQEEKEIRGAMNLDTIQSYYFAYGDVNKEKDLANNSTYTGRAFATAIVNDNYRNLTGTATLNTTGSEKLTLAFDNYYTFETAKIDSQNSFTISGSNGLNDRDFDIASSDNRNGSTAWQGYGNGADASEVVGTFNFNFNNSNKNIDINGSFGAKKQ